MSTAQRVDLYQPIMASRAGRPPLVLRIGVVNDISISEGVPTGTVRAESYVLLSALPEEIRRRVEVSVQALLTSV